MSFLSKRKRRPKPALEAEATVPVKHPKKRKVTPVEVKLLAIDALKAGIPSSEICDLIGVSHSALGKWRKLYQEGGEGALARQATNPGTRKICSDLEKRIEQMRRDNSEAGVRTGPGSAIMGERENFSFCRTSALATRSTNAW
jgi:transposase-like protein